MLSDFCSNLYLTLLLNSIYNNVLLILFVSIVSSISYGKMLVCLIHVDCHLLFPSETSNACVVP